MKTNQQYGIKLLLSLMLVVLMPQTILAENSPIEKESKEELVKKLKALQKSYQWYTKTINDPNSWVFIDAGVFNKKEHIQSITLQYTDEIIRERKKFNPDELSSRIKYLEAASRHGKKFIRTYTMPKISKKIEKLEKQLNLIPSYYELSGCWLLTVGKGVSVINIYQNKHKVYYGVLSKSKLRYYKQGDTIFEVTRKSGNTFLGREFTYTNEGIPLINNSSFASKSK